MGTEGAEHPLLLVIRTGHRDLREYLLQSITSRYRVHMIIGVAPEWELSYLAGWTRLTDTRDFDAVLDAARAVDAAGPVAGVLCWDESRIVQAAQIAEALGRPGPASDAVRRCRDKHLTRLALAAAGVAQPRFARVDTLAEAHDAAGRIGYPVVLKPSDLTLSMGVVRVDSPDQLDRLFGFTHGVPGGLPGYQARVLVEEYLPGDEISVDASVRRGRVTPLCLARKQLGFPPYCVEVGHYVDAADPLLSDPDVLALLERAHLALGFSEGVTHTEIKLTPHGPKIVEVNGRLGGGLIPYLGLRATGVDTGLAAADLACGRDPVTAPDRKLVAGVRFFFVDAPDTLIHTIRFDDARLPAAVDRLVPLAKTGDTASPPPHTAVPGRIAYAVAVAETVEDCGAALDAAGAALRINTD